MFFREYFAKTRPLGRTESLFFDFLVVVSASLLIGLSAQAELILPFSPVPMTLQTIAVLLAGLLLGKVRGASAVALYVIEGSAGMPFFSGGSAGVRHLIGPTGGYLLGFIMAAFIAGFFAELGLGRSHTKLFAALLIADASIFLFGLPWLSMFTGRYLVLQAGLYPFILGDLVKIILLSLSLPLVLKKAKLSI